MGLRRIYKRACRMFFGGIPIQNLDDDGPRIRFVCTRALRGGQPATCKIEVWNLGQLERDHFSNAYEVADSARKNILNNPALTDGARGRLLRVNEETIAALTMEAGYENTIGAIFRGSITNVTTRRDSNGVDLITTFEGGDGAIALRDGYISQFFDATSQENIRKVMIAASGLADDPNNTATIGAAFPGAAVTQFKNGKVYAQPVSEMMDEIMELYGLQWYIEGGVVKVLNPGQSQPLPAVVLQEGDELAAALDQQTYEDVKARAFLFPTLSPGRAVRFLDELALPITAFGHRIEAVNYNGDTHGINWFADIECRKLINAFATNALALAPAEAEAARRLVAAGLSTAVAGGSAVI